MLIRTLIAAGLLAALAPVAPAGQTLTVPGQFPTIQAAIDAAQPGDEVLVSDGTWRGPGNRDLSFGGKDIAVRSVNGPEATIIDAEGTSTEPFRGFVFEGGETRAALLEGFTITGGATLPGAIADTFNGGAVLIRSSSPTIRNCHFVANSSGCWGGAVYSGDTGPLGGQAAPLIEGCLFQDNFVGDDGGGFFTWGFEAPSEPTVIRNSVFVGNVSAVTGGAVTSFGGNELVLENVTMVDNEAIWGRTANIGQATILNSIIWGSGEGHLQAWATTDVRYSVIQGGFEGVGNMEVDPGFAADGYHLRADSPLVNAGSPMTPAVGVDIDGQPRVQDHRVDIGADEVRSPWKRATPTGVAVAGPHD